MNSAAVALANSNQLSLPDTALPLLLAFSFSVFYRVVGCFGLSFLCAYRWLNISAFRLGFVPSVPFCGQGFFVSSFVSSRNSLVSAFRYSTFDFRFYLCVFYAFSRPKDFVSVVGFRFRR